MLRLIRFPAREPPLPGESLTSLVRRQALAMGYDSLVFFKHVLSGDASPFPYHWELLPPGAAMEDLAAALDQPVSRVLDATVHPLVSRLSFGLSADGAAGEDRALRRFFHLASAPVCRLCLAEEPPYERLVWKFRPLGLCSKHTEWLRETCPRCGTRLSPHRLALVHCPCGFDLREAAAAPAHSAAAAGAAAVETWLAGHAHPIDRMSLPACFGWLERLVSAVERTPRWLEHVRAEQCVPTFVAAEQVAWDAAVEVLSRWPERFAEFLDVFQAVDKHRGTQTGVGRAFGLLLREAAELERYGAPAPAEVLREYLLARYTRGHLNRKICLFQSAAQQPALITREWLTQTAAARRLHLRHSAVAELVARGVLDGALQGAGRRRIGLVRRDSVERLQQQLSAALSVAQAAHRLHLGRQRVLELIHADLLPGCVRTRSGWRIFPSSLAPLETAIERLPVFTGDETVWIGAAQAARKYGPSGVTLLCIIQRVMAGDLPAMRRPELPGLAGLWIHRGELSQRAEQGRAQNSPQSNDSLHRLGRVLVPGRPLKATVLRKWIGAGLMQGQPLGRRWRIAPAEVARFRSTYCLAHEACAQLAISRATLSRWQREGRIQPVYGRGQNPGAGASLFRRDDVAQLRRMRRAG